MSKSILGWGIVCAAALVLGFYFFFPNDDPVVNYPSDGVEIIAFGDSLVEGVGATDGRDFVSVLSEKVSRPILNLGVSGDTTADGLARIDELDSYDPKVVILLLGGNDHLRKVPIEETQENLRMIIEDIQGRGAIVLLLGVRGGILTDGFKGMYNDLHEQYDTAYVSDVLSGLLGDSRYMSDPIHPNNAGHALIAERVYPVLDSLIE